MAAVPLPLGLGFYESFSKPLAAQECVNLYPNTPQTLGSTSPQSLFQTPGIKQFSNVGSDPNRGMIFADGSLFAVNGGTLFEIDDFGFFKNRGSSLGTGTGRVSIASNGLVLAIIVPGVAGFFYTFGDATAVQITDPTFLAAQAQPGGVTSVTYVSSVFVYNTDKEFFNGSVKTTNNGKDFNALDFDTADVKPDDIVRSFTTKNELYIFGENSTELYKFIGGADFPFQLISGATLDKGLTARFGVIEFDNSFVFLGGAQGESDAIWRGLSGSSIKISTPAIDKVIEDHSLEERQEAFAYTYSENGHIFVGFTLPNKTLLYDATESALQSRPVWHTRETNLSRWRVQDIAEGYGKTLVSDNVDGRIGHLSLSFDADYGETVDRTFAGAFIENQGRSLFTSSIELKTESGVGNEAGDPGGVEPVVNLTISDDGGFNFVDLGDRSLGLENDREARQIWNRLGHTPYHRIFKFTVDEPVKVAFIGLVADMNGGT